MPVVLYLCTLGILTVGGLCAFAYKGMCELSETASEEEDRAWYLAFLLAKRRTQYVILNLANGKEAKGFVLKVEEDALVVFLDTRRATVNEDTRKYEPKGEFRGPADIEMVDLAEVEAVHGFSGYADDGDYDDSPAGWIDDDDED